jgi:putative transcriptional regulator
MAPDATRVALDQRLGNTLKVERAIRDLTQSDLAALAGIARRSVNAIETGRMVPSVLIALKLAGALHVTVDSLFSLSSAEDDLPGGLDEAILV